MFSRQRTHGGSQRAGCLEEHPGVRVRQIVGGIREQYGRGFRVGRQMDVEEHGVAVGCRQALESVQPIRGISVGRLAIRDVNACGRKAVWMFSDPAPQNSLGFPSGPAHRGSIIGDGIEPHGFPDRLLHEPAGSVGNHVRRFVQSRGVVRDLADRNQFAASDRTHEAGTHILPVPEDSHVVVVADAFRLRAFDGKLLQPPIDAVGDTCGQRLSVFSDGDLVLHRLRLIDQEKKARRVVPADFCFV